MPDEVISMIEKMAEADKMNEEISYKNWEMTAVGDNDFKEELLFDNDDNEAQLITNSIPAIKEGVNITPITLADPAINPETDEST